ncbi:DNA-formamidopyrimidine glycosylase family protein [Lolliginicoccus suaedae]|uniref:DNA-formamidopyrimidine glycosylase family protein n=1 Tax=Lolliginicoccus suaedae TaxID=2605429 RepID=UPI0011EE9284|nr:DNA-formamidopyrimidine glycosylase family protein [Lolliginicoccus suaedae]
MPEGDTVYRAATLLRGALEGHPLERSQFRVPQYANLDVSGLTVDRIWPHGKHLFMAIGPHAIHTHLKMEGEWRVYPRGQRWTKPGWQARLVLATATHEAVGFQLGYVRVTSLAEADAATAHLGPDLLRPDWDPVEAVRRISAQPDRPIGVALLDQENLAGIGNIYRNELCFLRGIDPATPVSEVTDLLALVDLARRLLHANKDRANRCTTGNLRPGQQLWVYGRERKPCRRCRTPIEQRILGPEGYLPARRPTVDERLVFRCPHCQR